MSLLPLDLSPSIGVAAAVFGLGVLVWWRSRWGRGAVLFALLAMIFALWTSADWFKTLQPSVLPLQITIWRLIFYASASFGPALAYHAAAVAGSRPFRLKGWSAYALSFALFVLIDSSFLVRVAAPTEALGYALFDVGVIGCALFYAGMFAAAAARLLPVSHAVSADRLEKRRAIYGFVMLALFLLAGLTLFVSLPVPGAAAVTALACAFFLVSSMAFIRVRLFDAELTAIEAFFLILASGAIIVSLQAHTAFDALLSFAGALFVGVFGVMAVHAVRREISKRRELERLNRELVSLDEEKTDFTAMIAHQLRGPLGGLRFATDMLLRGDCGPLGDDARNVVGLMKNGADRLLDLAETALNAARSESGRFQTTRAATDVTAEVRALIAEVEPIARSKGLAVTSAFEDVPPRLMIDREILCNAVFNLLDNAVRYTQSGRADVNVALKNDRLAVTVSDTGAGLTKDELGGLFHRGGAGLGLYVVKKLTDAVKGSVRAQSEGLGRGSVFTVELPCARVDG